MGRTFQRAVPSGMAEITFEGDQAAVWLPTRRDWITIQLGGHTDQTSSDNLAKIADSLLLHLDPEVDPGMLRGDWAGARYQSGEVEMSIVRAPENGHRLGTIMYPGEGGALQATCYLLPPNTHPYSARDWLASYHYEHAQDSGNFANRIAGDPPRPNWTDWYQNTNRLCDRLPESLIARSNNPETADEGSAESRFTEVEDALDQIRQMLEEQDMAGNRIHITDMDDPQPEGQGNYAQAPSEYERIQVGDAEADSFLKRIGSSALEGLKQAGAMTAGVAAIDAVMSVVEGALGVGQKRGWFGMLGEGKAARIYTALNSKPATRTMMRGAVAFGLMAIAESATNPDGTVKEGFTRMIPGGELLVRAGRAVAAAGLTAESFQGAQVLQEMFLQQVWPKLYEQLAETFGGALAAPVAGALPEAAKPMVTQPARRAAVIGRVGAKNL